MTNTESLKDKILALFFTFGVSLKTWHDLGIIDREVAIYNRLSKHFTHIYFFTYGGREDMKYKDHLAGNITIMPIPFLQRSGYPGILMPVIFIYSLLIPFFYFRIVKRITVIKTNQMKGSWAAVLTKILFRKKLMVRTGYIWSLSKQRHDPESIKIHMIKAVERFAYHFADVITVSSLEGREYIQDRFRLRRPITILPNYIDTELFKPADVKKMKNSLCFVGRLEEEKNLFSLLKAAASTGYSLTLVGTGILEEELRRYAEQEGVKASFSGSIPNNELPELLNKHEIFMLPSLYEGMPKALLEAMACGLPCIGTDVMGTREVIEHKEDGYLCTTGAEAIRKAILDISNDTSLQGKLGQNARRKIVDNFSLKVIVEKEIELYNTL